MLRKLKSPSLFKRLENTMTYLMYDKSEMGRLYNGILRRSKIHIVDCMPSLSRAAVCVEGITPTFLFTPEFFEDPLQTQVDILCHEMYHLIMKHPILYRDLEGPRIVFRTGLPRPKDRQVVSVINLAADMSVNQRLRPEQVQRGWILPKSYGLEEHRDTPFYHHSLMELFRGSPGDEQDDREPDQILIDPDAPPSAKSSDLTKGLGLESTVAKADGSDPGDAGEPREADDGSLSEGDGPGGEEKAPEAPDDAGQGEGGQDAPQAAGNDAPQGDADQAAPILRADRTIKDSGEEGEKRKLHEGVQQDYGHTPDGQLANPHMMWKIGPDGVGHGISDPGMAEEAVRLVIAKAAEALTPQQRGTLPGWLQQEIEKALTPSRVPWYYTLRRSFARLGGMTMKKTMVRPNRHTGARPGVRPVLKRKIGVAIDESCSVSNEWVRQFKSEVHHAWTLGVEVWVITHNSVVTSTYRYNGKNLVWSRMGGGTDHTEVIEKANEIKLDLLVCLTDGYTGVNPGVRPRNGMKVGWVVTPEGANPISQDYVDFGFYVPIYGSEEEAA